VDGLALQAAHHLRAPRRRLPSHVSKPFSIDSSRVFVASFDFLSLFFRVAVEKFSVHASTRWSSKKVKVCVFGQVQGRPGIYQVLQQCQTVERQSNLLFGWFLFQKRIFWSANLPPYWFVPKD
jgi:hypothetical protein